MFSDSITVTVFGASLTGRSVRVDVTVTVPSSGSFCAGDYCACSDGAKVAENAAAIATETIFNEYDLR